MGMLGILLAAVLLNASAPPPDCSAGAAIVIHADSGECIYERRADEPMLIASTTKIMTAAVVLENCELNERVLIDERSAGLEGSSMYIKPGESYSVEELLYGMLLVSGNDAAAALAIHTAGSIEGFAELMNELAQRLHMDNSSFKNPHGLNQEGHYGSARDMARLAAYCMENPDFARIVCTTSRRVGDKVLNNHNRLLRTYPGCIGVKTGYTKAAGRALISCAEREGARYICVTFADPNDWEDHARLYDWAFANFRCEELISPEMRFSLPVISGVRDAVELRPACGVRRLLAPEAAVSYELYVPRFGFAPIEPGEVVGSIRALVDGELAAEVELICAESAELLPELRERISETGRRHIGGPYYFVEDR